MISGNSKVVRKLLIKGANRNIQVTFQLKKQCIIIFKKLKRIFKKKLQLMLQKIMNITIS